MFMDLGAAGRLHLLIDSDFTFGDLPAAHARVDSAGESAAAW
jgi:hypothetical protein